MLTQVDASAANGCTAVAEPALVAMSSGTTASGPVLYPGMYYMSQVGSQTAPSTVPCAAPVSAQIQATVADFDCQTVVVGTPARVVGEKLPVRCGSTSKEKQVTPSNSEDDSSVESNQGSMALVYQFIAGQWQPLQPDQLPVVPAPAAYATGSQAAQALSGQVSSIAVTDQNGTNASLASPATGPSFAQEQSSIGPEVKQSGQAQKLGQNASATVAVQAQAPGREVPELARTQPVQPLTETSITALQSKPEPSSIASNLPKTDTQSSVPPSPPETPEDVLTAALSASAEGAGTLTSSRRFMPSRLAPNQAPEKFADSSSPVRPEFTSGVNPSTRAEEKKSLSVDSKSVTTSQKNVGTSTANREIAMPYSVVNKSPSVDFSTRAGDGIQPNISTAAKADSLVAAQAPKLVQEIRAIADRISTIDRNSVEVRFDFSDTDRLSIRVEYRDGIVHTTFKTDSSQLRDAVAHEWQTQNASTEQRSYRMADPVFSQTATDRQNFSTPGDGSGRQRASEHQAQPATPSFTTSSRSTGLTTAVAAPAARSARPETSLHLHALA